jgi:hypothetical protein
MTINTKFNIGDEVWFVHRNEPFKGTILKIETNTIEDLNSKELTSIFYRCNYNYILVEEKNAFPDKQSLLNSL